MKITRQFTCRNCGRTHTVEQVPSEKPRQFCDTKCTAEFRIKENIEKKTRKTRHETIA